MKKLSVGVIGCGVISEIYLRNMLTLFGDTLDVVACADKNPAASSARGKQFGVAATSVDELIAREDVELIVNLTNPAAHFEVSKRALLAGKHVYSEKPLAGSLAEGRELLALAKNRGLLVASAPDTFLGAGLQTALEVIGRGEIGAPVHAYGFMLDWGPESFHPAPAFYYEPGAGPLMDMGPYYFTALAVLLGAATRVSGMASSLKPTRVVQNKTSPLYGTQFQSKVATSISASIEYKCGATANVVTTWDVQNPYQASGLPQLMVYGTQGALILPDPNFFGGVSDPATGKPGKYLKLKKGAGGFEDIPLVAGFTQDSRGLGVYKMARQVLYGEKSDLTGQLSLHVLEMLLGVLESAKSGSNYTMETTL
ncbi:MAG: Gfo/Idh/MocA family oxidoreductase [Oscillospiraceae bacterium]|jgi:predicted dehydrogenase|nr:Gfo/Idh/MocA family oxidoreductase [Oscillospiraceae bacterium]